MTAKRYKLPDQDGEWEIIGGEGNRIDGYDLLHYRKAEERIPEILLCDSILLSGDTPYHYICTATYRTRAFLTDYRGKVTGRMRDQLALEISAIWRDGEKIYQRRS
jgi:hypothetical protein